MQISSSHIVLIPSYNPGPAVYETVAAARLHWNPVWVVVDGSNDGTAEGLQRLAETDDGMKVIVLKENGGKGTAVLHGLQLALQQNYSHVLTMDSDGQHDAAMIPVFMEKSARRPDAMVLGLPVFDDSAPAVRVQGRKVSNWLTNMQTCWAGIGDSLFGFRVYPIKPLHDIMVSQRGMRRFDFDPEAAVRLCWHGVTPINIPTKVRYLKAAEGGVSHFNYWRDNKLLARMYIRLFMEFVLRFPNLLWRRVNAA